MHSAETRSAIQALDPPVRGLILDIDGVLWKDAEPIGDLAAAFSAIRALGLQVSIATNNAMNSVEDYRVKLQGFGVKVDAEQIITSAEATADTLLTAFPGCGTVFLVGERGVQLALEQRGFQVVTDPAVEASFVAVVAGIDRDLSYARLQGLHADPCRCAVLWNQRGSDISHPGRTRSGRGRHLGGHQRGVRQAANRCGQTLPPTVRDGRAPHAANRKRAPGRG